MKDQPAPPAEFWKVGEDFIQKMTFLQVIPSASQSENYAIYWNASIKQPERIYLPYIQKWQMSEIEAWRHFRGQVASRLARIDERIIRLAQPADQ